MVEEDAGLGEAIEMWGVDKVIAAAAQGVEALLVGADPQDVRARARPGGGAQDVSSFNIASPLISQEMPKAATAIASSQNTGLIRASEDSSPSAML